MLLIDVQKLAWIRVRMAQEHNQTSGQPIFSTLDSSPSLSRGRPRSKLGIQNLDLHLLVAPICASLLFYEVKNPSTKLHIVSVAFHEVRNPSTKLHIVSVGNYRLNRFPALSVARPSHPGSSQTWGPAEWPRKLMKGPSTSA